MATWIQAKLEEAAISKIAVLGGASPSVATKFTVQEQLFL